LAWAVNPAILQHIGVPAEEEYQVPSNIYGWLAPYSALNFTAHWRPSENRVLTVYVYSLTLNRALDLLRQLPIRGVQQFCLSAHR